MNQNPNKQDKKTTQSQNSIKVQIKMQVANIKQSQSINENKKQQKKNSIKKKRIPTIVYPQFICKLSNSLYLPQDYYTQPQKLKLYEEALIKIFNFKTLSSVTNNQFYICINFKSIVNQIQKIEEQMQKHQFFSDRYFEDLVLLFDDLQRKKQQKKIVENNRSISKQQELIQKIKEMKNRKFLCYFYEMKKSIILVSKIFISKQLLKTLGISTQEILSDFIKYRHVFIQILTAQFCEHLINQTGKSLKFIFDKVRTENLGEKQYLQLSSGKFQDFIYRQKLNNFGIKIQEKISATISFFKIFPTSTFIQILDVNEQTVFESRQIKRNQMFRQFQSQIKEDQNISLSQIINIKKQPNINIERQPNRNIQRQPKQ